MTHLYTILFCKRYPIWGKLGAFLAKFSKIHPILQIGRIGYVTITHPSIYQILRKCTSKPLSIPVNHLSVRTPPPGDDCIDKIGNAKFVSKFNLLKGYWQVPLTDRAKEISAFCTPDSYAVWNEKCTSNISKNGQSYCG